MRRLRYSLLSLLASATALAIGCWTLVQIDHKLRGPPQSGPVYPEADWPYPLRECLRQAAAHGLHVSDVRVYCIRNSIDQDHLFEFPFNDKLLRFLITHWKLVPISSRDKPVVAFEKVRPDHIGTPSRTSAAMYWKSIGWQENAGGHHFVAMQDATGRQLLVWHHFIF
jgi:hypothetical protein